ncbi:MAG TPA: chromosome segregation protein SMC [Ruminococcaceae bacterium]|nr:chromosome segregation protein SMC [Oscillospiraceae bacterium]
MRLKSLELQGFKTFPDKTVLDFDGGITAVVGPNGSGKSNISDAVRWALGEQSTRTLRCTKMEDVIFNGTPARKALGFAQVTVNIENSDRQLPVESDDVVVTRRYYRSGDSEYLLNKTNVRLKDINELFMDTGLGRDGYSIIGQGKIDAIVSAKSEDRREIFEEAAGISRFRYRKGEAEHRLSQTEDNLLRLRDIVSELESRVGPLKEQSERAKKYLGLAEKKKQLEISIWLDGLERCGQALHEQEDRILISKSQYDDAERAVNDIDNKIEGVFRKSNSYSAQIDGIRRKSAAYDEEAVKKDGQVSVLENDISHCRENISRIKKEIEISGVSDSDLQKEIEAKEKQISEKEDFLHNNEKDFSGLSLKIRDLKLGINESENKIDGFTRGIAELTSEATKAKVDEMTAVSSISDIKLRILNLNKSISDKKEYIEKLCRAAGDYGLKLESAKDRAVKCTNEAQGYELKLESRRARAERAKNEDDKLKLDINEQSRRARLLEDLENNMEGFAQSVKAVMKESSRGALNGILGPVSRLIKVPEQYSTAIETALGGAMQHIVVENETDAKRAISLLKQKKAGRATFLPVSSVNGRTLDLSGAASCTGFVGIASGLCSCGEKYRGILDSLLGRTAVAENLDCAVDMAKRYGYKFKIVTLDGQVVNAGGSLTGGSLVRNSGLLSRASEIEKIKCHIAELRKTEQQSATALKAALEEASQAEALLSGAKGELSSAKEQCIRLDAEHRRLLASCASEKKTQEELSREEESERGRLKNQEEARAAAEKLGGELNGKINELKGQLESVSGGRGELSKSYDELSEKVKKLEMERLSAQKDIESLAASVKDIKERRKGQSEKTSRLHAEIALSEDSILGITKRIDALKNEAVKIRGKSESSKSEIDALNAKRMELEKQSVELRAEERLKSEEKEKISHELARLDEQKANLQKGYDETIAKLWEEYELTRREAEDIYGGKIKDAAKAKMELGELKSAIKSLGSVNVAAVDEYKEVSERYEFMKSQVADVEKSRGELLKLISGLTKQMQELFTIKFDKINKNFAQTFRDLFGGGSACISLTDENDVLNSGIEISVQPPGKIVSHLESLSGGEKALVAISLYFAIMKVNPPPFCVLDEIEAALDDVNVNRFAAYLRRMNENTQFIVITHRRGSMEEADVLYGVTMQDKGVSKLLEMPVAEIEEKMGIKR